MRRALESHPTENTRLLDTKAASSGGAVRSLPAACRRPCLRAPCHRLSARVTATFLVSCALSALLLAFRVRVDTCPAVPDTAVIAAMEAADAEAAADVSDSSDPHPRAPHFLLIWSTSASSFGLVPGRCLESIFYHHPRATVTIYSNQLPATHPTGAKASTRPPSATRGSVLAEAGSVLVEAEPRPQPSVSEDHLSIPPTPNVPVIQALIAHGYNVRVRPYNLTTLLSGTPSAPWLRRLDEWRREPYFYSHITDVLRLALLFRHGGVYLDSDVILLRPLRMAGMPAALARPPPDGAPHAELRDALGIESYDLPPPTFLQRLGFTRSVVGGGTDNAVAVQSASAVTSEGLAVSNSHLGRVAAVLENTNANDASDTLTGPASPRSAREGLEVSAPPLGRVPMLNGAILVFPSRHSRFLWAAMAEFASSYNQRSWGWNGPELLTRVALARCAAVPGVEVQIHPPDTFYPIYWRGLERLASAPDGPDAALQRRMWQRLRRRAYTVHLWNRKTAELELQPGSLLHRLLHTWTVLPSSLEKGDAGGGRSLGSVGRANISVGGRVRL